MLISAADSSVTLVNFEHQPMYMYDADVIGHLVNVTQIIFNDVNFCCRFFSNASERRAPADVYV